MSISRCGPGRGSRQAVQVSGTLAVEEGIDQIEESIKIILLRPKSWGGGLWMVDG